MKKKAYQIRYFQQKLREINFQLEELSAATEMDLPGHLQYCQELLEDLESEFRHVMIYQEEAYWPVCEAWKLYNERMNSPKILQA